MELFAGTPNREPLAARMRPRNLEEFAGQDHIVGPGRLLRRAIQADQLSSIIVYGPPGTGKTTLARVIANTTKSRFESLNAVLSGVKDVRKAIAEAGDARDLHGRRTILFVDEVHRWNKAQQDALLPWVENGTVVLIGATTENPYFEVIPALVSRSRVFQLTALVDEDLMNIARQALTDAERGYGRWPVEFEEGALEHLVKISSGDARSLLNALQLAVETTPAVFPPPDGTPIAITLEAAEESIQQKVLLYDKEGDYHFDTISAFIKSLRGSDPDAALYWLALMIRGGEDPKFILRRMLISASEDVGLADPNALVVVEAAAAAFERIGLPEGQFPLAQAALYLATCPKSNSTLGFFDALKTVDRERASEVPGHLKDASRDKHAFGHGEGYRYPHAWRDHWVAQQYLPEGLSGRLFYRPTKMGYEGDIRNIVTARREAQISAILEGVEMPPAEILTYSPGDDQREAWVRRTESGLEPLIVGVRNALFHRIELSRHHRVLVAKDRAGALLWEAHRRVPEGGVTFLCDSTKALDALSWVAGGIPEPERPQFVTGSLADPEIAERIGREGGAFEAVIGRNLLTRELPPEGSLQALKNAWDLAAPEGRLVLVEARPTEGTILPDLVQTEKKDFPGFDAFREAEISLREELSGGAENQALLDLLGESGWSDAQTEPVYLEEERLLTPGLLQGWLDSTKAGAYGYRMAQRLGESTWSAAADRLERGLTGRRVPWKTAFTILTARCPS